MTSTAGIQGHTTTATWPQTNWPRIRRSLAHQTAVTRSSLAAGRAYDDAKTDAGRRQVLAAFLTAIR